MGVLKKSFEVELRHVAPQRTIDVEADVELADDVPVARKQFRLNEGMKQAIRTWTAEMLAAGIIRPSNSPYCALTFCQSACVLCTIFVASTPNFGFQKHQCGSERKMYNTQHFRLLMANLNT
ncbi:Hypothetical protein PHPALM_14326 [Phytophthora palmivora]|uniref:Uncharacterized protein n=1 Tax=Phytophthora palmivora TaxID=4796 RepID=A0A2P4XV20_9STRA|nr:Hypothetical protein PHPALM_14326 [Phytophthora palmivora]